jgi:hypothetical protein
MITQTYGYDSDAELHGDITFVPQLTAMAWDSRDQERSTSKQGFTNLGTSEITFYVYDMSGHFSLVGSSSTFQGVTLYDIA